MRIFGTMREAKEFLVSCIAEEAERENLLLTEIERKMLYFSETDWTLPDMQAVSEEFDRNYDQDEYEAKIAGLIRSFENRTQAQDQEKWDAWTNAVEILSKGDHYLLVMINAPVTTDSVRPPWDFLKLVLAAVAVSAVLLTIMYIFRRC